MDSVVHSALEEICCGAANGLHLRNLWPKLSPYLTSQGLPLCPNIKRAVWEYLMDVPGLQLEVSDGSAYSNSEDLMKCTVEECEKMNVKIVAPESMRKSFLGIYEMEAPESSLSDFQRLILERLAVARKNGIAQSELSKELSIEPKNLFYPLKRLETQGLIVRQSTVIRTKQALNTERNNDSVVTTNMIYLYRYAKHFGSQQRLEITKEDKLLMDRAVADGHTETGKEFGEEIAKENVQVKDFLPALKAICEKLDKAQGKVLVISDLKQDLGYRGTHGHRAWRNIYHKLKDAGVVEECCTMIKNKKVNCLRLVQNFSPSCFEPKLHGRGHDDIDTEQSKNSLERGQITEQLAELHILRQAYDMVDAAGTKGLTNIEVCRRLGLCSKEYHKRYFNQMISRFGLRSQRETHNRTEVYRVWTAENFNQESSNKALAERVPTERETLKEVNESNLHVVDLDSHEELSQPLQVIDTSTSMENGRCINGSQNDAAVSAEASDGTNVGNRSSSILLLQHNQQTSDVELSSVVTAEELLRTSNSVKNNNLLETRSLAVVTTTPTPSRHRSNLRYPRLTMGATSSQREQHILKMLQEEKFLIKPELHRRLESLEKEKNTTMDRKTLLRCLNKLQEEGHCKCIHLNVPSVTNYAHIKGTEVILHSSIHNVSPELLAQINDKMRSSEIQVRKQSCIQQKKGQSVPVLDKVERIPNSVRSDVQSERAEVMRANGLVLPKMVRTKLLHIFFWDWMHSSPDWDDALLSCHHCYDMKNPHSTCKLFELDLAIRSMPLAQFLQVVGSTQKSEDMVEKCRSGLLLSDLPAEDYKAIIDTRATGRLSWLIYLLRRLKLIRLVSKGHAEDGANSSHATLAHALELKPYIEEPVITVASAGLASHDLRPQVRHDFVLSSRKAVDAYWNTLEYCYCAAKSRAALLAFPGTAVHEVFHPRSWASSRAMTADERMELHKRVAKDDPKERLSFSECEKIAEDLNLTLEQVLVKSLVLRVYSDKRQQRLPRIQRDLDAESQEPQTVKGKHILSSCKRKRCSSRVSSKLVKASVADSQSSLKRGSLKCYADDKIDGPEELKLNDEDKEAHTFIHKKALSKLNVSRQKKFFWSEEADRQLVIEYATRRAALGAKFHRVDWASIQSLPAPPETCKRRMAVLNGYLPFRKAVMKLCNMLGERYLKYLEKCQDKVFDQGDCINMFSDPTLGENNLKSSASISEEWANFDEDIISVTLDDVLRYKRMTKLEAVQDTFPDQENSEDDDYEVCDRTKASGQRSRSRQYSTKYLKLSNDGGSVCRQMQESVAIANAAELFKLIFLSNSKAPEVPILLAETLRRYSEHDLYAAFNYLREKRIMIGGSSNSPFVLSQYFMQSISPSTFPTDTGQRAVNFVSWLHEREKELMEEGVDVPSDLQCGEVFTLCALVSSGELSIAPCLPDEGVGEAEDNRISKHKCDDNDLIGEETSKKLKTFAGEGEMTSRREKGFPGLKLCLHRETFSRSLAIESFKDGIMYPTPSFAGKDQGILTDVNCGTSDSDIADYVREILDSERAVHRALVVGESPWEAMTRYAVYLMSSCSYAVDSSNFHPNLFKNLYSAIQKSGDNGLSMEDIHKVSNIEDEKILEVTVEVLEAFGRALKVNAYDSIHVVDSLYRSKYFLTSVYDRAGNCIKGRKRKFEDEHIPLNLDSPGEIVASLENEMNTSADGVHRLTILNLPEDVSDPSTDKSIKDKITGYQHSDLASPQSNRVENLLLESVDTRLCALLPWMNGDGTINEPVYNGLIRRVFGIVMQNPGILEDNIINQMHGLNPQSCRKLLEILIMDNHIMMRKMQQTTSSQPPSILGNLLDDRFRKPNLIISRVHYFANPMSTTLL
ncbi:hypothetical protein OROMI_017853 [Orobanche minor]